MIISIWKFGRRAERKGVRTQIGIEDKTGNVVLFVQQQDLSAAVGAGIAGAAGVAVTKFLLSFGVRDAILCDSKGIIHRGRPDLNPSKQEIARITNPRGVTGSMADAIHGADVFLGLSVAGIVTPAMVGSMAVKPAYRPKTSNTTILSWEPPTVRMLLASSIVRVTQVLKPMQ